MKIAITGPNGYIGNALTKVGAIPLDCDVSNYFLLERVLLNEKPDIVIHLAAKTNIEKCESAEDFQTAYDVNVLGAHNVGSALSHLKIPGVFISSYHVWHGGVFERHKEGSKLTPAKNRYGMMKAAGEFVASQTGMKIVRTSYVFDKMRLEGKLDDLRHGKKIAEPAFMKRSFIHLNHFTRYLIEYSARFSEMPPILHLASRDSMTWYEFMKTVAEAFEYGSNLVSPRIIENSKFAPRPWNGALDTSLSQKHGFRPVTCFDGILEMLNESLEMLNES